MACKIIYLLVYYLYSFFLSHSPLLYPCILSCDNEARRYSSPKENKKENHRHFKMVTRPSL